MKLERISLVVLAALFLQFGAATAKEKPVNDAVWLGAGLKYEFVKDFEAELDYKNRSELNGDKDVTNLIDLGVTHDFSKIFSAGVTIRLRHKKDNTDFEWKPFVAGKYKIFDPVTLAARLMYHHEYDRNDNPEEYARFRVALEYDFSKVFSAKIRTEAFYHFCHDAGDRFDQTRSGIELEYKIIKPLSVSVFWQYDDEFNESKNQDSRIIGLTLGYKFKNK